MAGVALATMHCVSEGLASGPHVVGGLIAVVLIVTIEAIAVLAAFATLGRFLGLRAPRREPGDRVSAS